MNAIQQSEKVEKFLRIIKDELYSLGGTNWSDQMISDGGVMTKFINFLRCEATELFGDWCEQGKLTEREFLREEIEWWAKEHIADTGLRQELTSYIKGL